LLEGEVAGLEAGLNLDGLGDDAARQQLEDRQGRLAELRARAGSTSRDHPLRACLPKLRRSSSCVVRNAYFAMRRLLRYSNRRTSRLAIFFGVMRIRTCSGQPHQEPYQARRWSVSAGTFRRYP
jgi:hypothetical protein